MRFGKSGLVPRVATGLAAAAWLGCASGATAQTPGPDGAPFPWLDEVRFGALAHSIDVTNGEDGADLNLELLFRRPGGRYDNPLLDFALRPRVHIGASVNTVGDTSQIYAGLSWDVKLAPKLSLELTFGAALHDGQTEPAARLLRLQLELPRVRVARLCPRRALDHLRHDLAHVECRPVRPQHRPHQRRPAAGLQAEVGPHRLQPGGTSTPLPGVSIDSTLRRPAMAGSTCPSPHTHRRREEVAA